MRGGWLTPKVKAWLREHYSDRPVAVTRYELLRRFGVKPTVGQLRSANRNHGFGAASRSGSRTFDREEERWLHEQLPKAPRADVRRRFAVEFGWEPKACSLDNYAHRHRLLGAPNAGRFKPGSKPSPKAYPKGPNRTSFRKGSRVNRVPERPMFSETWRGKGARRQLYIKVPEPHPSPSHADKGWNQRSHWTPKSRWAWRQANGPIPEGHAIVHLDGDRGNCKPDNLVCVPKAVLARLNASHAPKGGGAAYPARVRLAQLRQLIAERAS